MRPNRQIWLIAILSTCFTLTLLAGTLLVFSRVGAAPGRQVATPTPSPDRLVKLSLSALAFLPVSQTGLYSKDTTRQLLSLAGQNRNFNGGNNLFIAPLDLPDQTILLGLTFFGEDFDNQGAVRLRLKRCDHGQSRCVSLTDITSTDAFALGRFETAKIPPLNEVINNDLHAYFLELELTALNNSGLRSARLELVERSGGGASAPPVEARPERWDLSGNVTNFLIPNSGLNQIRICSDDLSHLPNVTHFPTLIVDGQSSRLSSNQCIVVWGRTIQLRRPVSAGPSSGTYQILP
jgi:hypothetical protein